MKINRKIAPKVGTMYTVIMYHGDDVTETVWPTIKDARAEVRRVFKVTGKDTNGVILKPVEYYSAE